MSSPTELGPSDLDFDGTDLWLSSGTGDGYRIAAANGGIVEHVDIGFNGGRDNGIAFRAGDLFVGGLFGGIEVYEASTGAALGSAVHQDGTAFAQSEVGPSVFVGSELVILSSLGLTYYSVAAQTSP
jgi:hypothetical protein